MKDFNDNRVKSAQNVITFDWLYSTPIPYEDKKPNAYGEK